MSTRLHLRAAGALAPLERLEQYGGSLYCAIRSVVEASRFARSEGAASE